MTDARWLDWLQPGIARDSVAYPPETDYDKTAWNAAIDAKHLLAVQRATEKYPREQRDAASDGKS